MGIALLTLSSLFQQWPSWTARRPARPRSPASASQHVMTRCPGPLLGTGTAGSQAGHPGGARADGLTLPSHRPLRVLQLSDGKGRPGSVGKLLMSGRMADVCAELERLSALEERRALH